METATDKPTRAKRESRPPTEIDVMRRVSDLLGALPLAAQDRLLAYFTSVLQERHARPSVSRNTLGDFETDAGIFLHGEPKAD